MADKTVILEVNYDTDEAQKNIDNLAVKLDGLKESNKQYNQIVKDARKDLKKTDEQLKAEGKSREQLAKNIKAGTVAMSRNKDAMSKTSKERSKAIKEITGEKSSFDKLNESLKENTKAQNKSTGALNAMPGATGGAVKGIMGMVKASLAFIATPLGAVIAAIVLGLKALMSFLKGSEEGQNKLNKIMAVGSAVIGNLGDVFRDFGKLIFDSLKVMGARFTKFFGNIKLGWQKIKGVFKDNTAAIEEQRKAIAEADKILTQRQNERKKSAEELKNGLKGIVEETKKDIEISQKLADRQAALDLLQRSFLVERAKLEAEIAENLTKSKDKEKFSAAERVKFLQEAIDKENEILDTNQKITDEKLALKKIQNSLSDSTKEDLNEQAQLEAEVFNVQKSNSLKRKKLTSQLLAARKEITAEQNKQAKASEKASEADAKAQQEIIERRAATIEKLAEIEYNRVLNEEQNIEAIRQLQINQANDELRRKLENEKLSFEELQSLKDELSEEELEIELERRGILYEEYLLAETEFKNRLVDIDSEYNAKIAESREANLQGAYESMQNIIRATKGMAGERVGIISDAFSKISTINFKELQNSKDTFMAIASAAAGLTALITAGHQQELDDLETKKAYELSLVGDNQAAQAAINQRYARESAQLKTKQAKEDKTAAIIDATIATALGIVSALANSGNPILGIVMAALVGALGIYQIASIASQPTPKFSYAKGGMIGGNPHSQGGTRFYGEDGNMFEAERDEAMFVLKKDATAEIAALSMINESHGGRSFFGGGSAHLQDGGQATATESNADLQATVQEELQRTPIVVKVGDIETGLTETQDTKLAGVI